jgi:putative hydrolase of HD superfamily
MKISSPLAVVQQQLDAYNAKDVDAWLATFAPDAEQFVLHGERLAGGHQQMRARMEPRFAEPGLHAKLLNRTLMGNVVVDLEIVTRNFPEGRGEIETLCIYEIADGLIKRASYAFGQPRLSAA